MSKFKKPIISSTSITLEAPEGFSIDGTNTIDVKIKKANNQNIDELYAELEKIVLALNTIVKKIKLVNDKKTKS